MFFVQVGRVVSMDVAAVVEAGLVVAAAAAVVLVVIDFAELVGPGSLPAGMLWSCQSCVCSVHVHSTYPHHVYLHPQSLVDWRSRGAMA